MAWGSKGVESGKVFCTEDGSPLHPNDISDVFEDLTVEAGLPPIHFTISDTAGSLMLAAGVDMKVVQETLDHSSVVLTAKHLYVGPSGSTRADLRPIE